MTMMDVPDDWGLGSSSLPKNTNDDDDDGKEEGWLTKPSEKVALPKKKKKKTKTTTTSTTTPGGGGGAAVAAPRASGRVLGRRRRAKEKRKRLAMMKKTHRRDVGGGGSPEDDEEDEERDDDIEGEKNNPASSSSSPPPPTTRSSNVAKHDATMTEKQKRKAEKNRARKLRREWKRKKEMEEKKDDLGSRSDEEKENETKKTKQPDDEERKEMKRLAKDYVAEKAKKRAKATTTAEEDGGGRNSRSSEKDDEEDRAPVHQPVKQKKLSLIDKMRAKLSGGHFRMLNEQLYTTKGDEALHLVQQNPGVFSAYHEGFREQVKKWPKNPVHKCFEWLQHKPYDTVVADFGCGDAELAKLIGKSKKKVYSLDLETPSHAPFVIACNMAKTPLESNSIDVAVFSLSLMGTDYYKFIEEASRVLKVKGTLWIAEVKSRFDGKNGTASISSFISSLKNAGFDVNPKKVDEKDKMFFALEAVKTKNTGASSNDDGGVDDGKTKKKKMKKSAPVDWPTLKACEYKKR